MQNERVSNERLAEMPERLRDMFAKTMPSNWAEVLESRAGATHLDDTMGTVDLLRATAVYLRQQRRASLVTPELEKAARRLLGLLVGDSYPGILLIPEDVDANDFANAYAELEAALSVVSHETGGGETEQADDHDPCTLCGKVAYDCECADPTPTDETQGVKREPIMWRWRGPNGGWIAQAIKPSWSAEALFSLSQLEAVERERAKWQELATEDVEALQAIGDEFGILGGENRVAGVRRILTEQRASIAAMREALKTIEAFGSDGEHSGDRHARCRDIARAAIAAGENG